MIFHIRARLLRGFLGFTATVYGIMLVYLLFIRNRLHHMIGDDTHRFDWNRPFANLTPFHTIRGYLFHSNRYNYDTWFQVFFGNLVLFLPFGVLAPMISVRMRSFPHFFIVLFLLLLGVELAQKLTLTGAFDVDDIILNMVGGLIGYAFVRIIFRSFDSAMPTQNV